jgi:hypothetical protein
MQFTNKMTFIPEEYAKLTDVDKIALYDVRKDAREKAPSRNISAAVTAPAPTASPAPTPAQRTFMAIMIVPITPVIPPSENGYDIHQLLSNSANRSNNQAQQAPAAPTNDNDIFLHEGVIYCIRNVNLHYKVNGHNASFKSGSLLMVVSMVAFVVQM